MDREDAAREIAASGRAVRKHGPPWLWAIALILAAICIVPLVLAWFATPGELPLHAEPPPAGSGLGTGIAIGFVVGVGVGFAIARKRTRQ